VSGLVYEVTLRVDRDIAGDYQAWLHQHVREMLALPGFVAATVFELPDAADAASVVYCCHYRLVDRAALDDYLQVHAARMRGDGQLRFAGRFSAERRILVPVADY
jgi:quinol monooxygenase YgiN